MEFQEDVLVRLARLGQMVRLMYAIQTGQLYLATNKINKFILLWPGNGRPFFHSSTGAWFQAGAVLYNDAKVYMKLEDDGNWSSYASAEKALPEGWFDGPV